MDVRESPCGDTSMGLSVPGVFCGASVIPLAAAPLFMGEELFTEMVASTASAMAATDIATAITRTDRGCDGSVRFSGTSITATMAAVGN